ncbi:MAG: hypothetical protein ACRD2J_03820 [Thermoanaerobaculia bacterium]
MTGYLAITSRELQERRVIFLMALLIGFLALVIPVLQPMRESPLIVSIVAAVGFGLGIAILGGSGMLGRDLIERRAGFYLARPVTSLAIWGGKMTAAILLAVLSFAIVLLPALLFRFSEFLSFARRWDAGDMYGFTLFAFLIFVLVCVGLGYLLTIALRSRSIWVVLDLLAPMVLALGIWTVMGWLASGMARKLIGWSALTIASAFLVAVWTAGALGFVQGRSELREVHKRTSIALWSIMTAVVLGFVAFGAWVRSPGIDDFRDLTAIDVSRRGDLAIFSGRRGGPGHYVATFAVTSRSADPQRLGSAFEVLVADDGKSAVWLESSVFRPDLSTVIRGEVDGDRIEAEGTEITILTGADLDLSPDGRLLAALQGDTLSVWDVPTGRSIASAKLPPAPSRSVFRTSIGFQGGAVRVYRTFPGPVLHIDEFDPASRRWASLASIPLHRRAGFFDVSRDGSTLLLRDAGTGGWTLANAASGETRASLGSDDGAPDGWARFLPDSRVFIYSPDSRQFVLFDAAGKRLRDYPAPPARLTVPSMPREGWLTYGVLRAGANLVDYDLRLLNLETGETREVARGMRTIGWANDEDPGSFGSKLYLEGNRSLVHFDAFTGERRVIVSLRAES